MNNLQRGEFLALVVGGSLLAANAGFINVITLSGLYSYTVSHVTGNTSKLAIFMLDGMWSSFEVVFAIVFAFFVGAFVAGFVVGDAKFRLGQSYGMVLLIESAALLMSFFLLANDQKMGELFAAFACGTQNAMVSTYSGAIVRTTHMTGILSDIGSLCGQLCRPGTKAERWRFKVLVPLYLSYFLGGVLGRLFYIAMGSYSLLIPALLVGGCGLAYLSSSLVRDARVSLRSEAAQERVAAMIAERHLQDQYGLLRSASVINSDIRALMDEMNRNLTDGRSSGKLNEESTVSLRSASRSNMSRLQ